MARTFSHIYLVRASSINDVRLLKFARFFHSNSFTLSYIGIDRGLDSSLSDKSILFSSVTYLFSFLSTRNFFSLSILKFRWFFSCFFAAFKLRNNKSIYYLADFESALPFILCFFIFNKLDDKYIIYDIYDTFTDRYIFPKFVNSFFISLDKFIRSHSSLVIHVDSNRTWPTDNNYLIIENIPIDMYSDLSPKCLSQNKPIFILSGWLTTTRGLTSILSFYTKYSSFFDLHIHGQLDPQFIDPFLQAGADLYPFTSQESYFLSISNATCIFALYDPAIPIHQKIASNKLFDSLMLGKIIITNYGTNLSSFVENNSVGISVNYYFDPSWDKIITSILDEDSVFKMSFKSRSLFSKYSHAYHVSLSTLLDKISC